MLALATSPSSERAGWRDGLMAALVVAFVVGGATTVHLTRRWGARPTAEQCAALLDLVVQHESHARHAKVTPAAVVYRQQELRAEPRWQAELRRCREELSASAVRCALAAPNVDELERCVQ